MMTSLSFHWIQNLMCLYLQSRIHEHFLPNQGSRIIEGHVQAARQETKLRYQEVEAPPPPTQWILSKILSFLHTLRFQPPFSPRIVSLIQYIGLIDLQLVNRVDPPDRIVRGQSVLQSRDGWAVESIWEQFSSNFHREEIELRTHCGSNFEQR